MGVVPYRIETERLVIRCYEPDDAPLLMDAVNSSLDHLAPWMPWADHAVSLDEEVDLLRSFRSQYDRDENWVMGVFDAEETRIVGGSGFHPRGGDGSLEIGYWVRADSVRQGITTEVTAALTRVGFENVKLDRVDLQIEPTNVASLGVPRKLGFVHEGTLRRRLPRAEGQPRADSMVFTMLREEYEQAPWREAYPYVSYDALGREL